MNINKEDIINNIDLNKKIWRHIYTTNCYAYALGLDLNENKITENAYQPGVIGGYLHAVNRSQYFTYSSLIEGIFKDMKVIGLDIREIKYDEEVSKDEWKIALFTTFHAYEFYSEWLSDFHFLRQIGDIWYHKPGYHSFPTNKDSYGKIIMNPNDCYLHGKEYRKTYSLKIK